MGNLSQILSIQGVGGGAAGTPQVAELSALKIQSRQVEIRNQIDAIRKADTLSEADKVRRSTLTAAKSFNDNSVKAFDTLSEKLNAVRIAARGITGGAGFFGFSFKSSDEAFATGTALKGTQVGDFKLTIDTLATANTKASGTFTDANGKTVAFTSDEVGSNTVTDAGGITGLTLQLKQTTGPATTTTTTTTTLTGLGSVRNANKAQDTLSIKKSDGDDDDDNAKKIKADGDDDDDNAKKIKADKQVKQGDKVRLTGTAIGGVDANKDYFVRLDGDKIKLFDTLAHANGSGAEGLVDITANGEVKGASISRVTTTTTTTTTTPANAVTITVGREKWDAIAAAKDFFKAVSDALSFADSATAQGGALAGDRTAVSAATDLRRSVIGGFAAFGDGLKSKGKGNAITLDSATVDKIIDADFSKVESLFRDGNGIARKVEAFSARTLGVGGMVDTRLNGLNRSSSSIDNQLEELRVKAEDQRAKLLKSFAGIASSLSSVSKQSAFISQRGKDTNASTSQVISVGIKRPTLTLIKPNVTNPTGLNAKLLEQFRLDHPVVTENN